MASCALRPSKRASPRAIARSPACAASPSPAQARAAADARYSRRSRDRRDAPARGRIRRARPPPRRRGCRRAITRTVSPCSASPPTTTSSAMSLLPVMTRSGIAADSPISVTLASVPASSADASASISRNPSACEKLVTAPEPFGVGNATAPRSPCDQRHQHEFLAAELGRDAHRHFGLDAARGFRRQAGARADHRRDEGVKGEDRRGRKSRQHRQRLAVEHGEAERLAGLERDAVHDDAGLAQPRHHAVRKIARAFRGAAREHHHVAGRRARCASQARASSRRPGTRRTGPARRPPPRPRPRRSRRCCRRPRPACSGCARRHQLVAGREHGDLRPSHHVDLRRCRRPPACRSRASRCARPAAAPPRRARCRSRHRR